ncbi:MAG TPA: DUF748 domain-containing protein, partial [Candidatus Eisenbacteria bacterium]
TFEDRTVRPPFDVSVAPVNVTVKNISSRPGARFDVESDMTIAERGHFECSGSVTATPASADLKLRLADLPLAIFQTYLNPVAKLRLVSGSLGLSGAVTFRDQKPVPDVRFQGRLESHDFVTRDRIDNERFLTWKSLDVDGVEATPARVRIASVRFGQPYAKFIIHRDHTTNIQDILGLTPQPSDSSDLAAGIAEPDTGSATTAPEPAPSAVPAPAPASAPARARAEAAADSGPQAMLGKFSGDAPFCDNCGHITIRNGTCFKCLNCGNSMGCS